MKIVLIVIGFIFASVCGTFASEHSMLARVTVYWHSEGCGQTASFNGARLRTGHCAVDPKKIPYGSKVIFEDAACVAVDTGPAVVSRKAARSSGRNSDERDAIVIDRFFETKEQALTWANAHPHFMKVRVVQSTTKHFDPADSEREVTAL